MVQVRYPFPHPLHNLSIRDIAYQAGIPYSSLHRALRYPERLQSRHIAALIGTFALPFDTLFEVRPMPINLRVARDKLNRALASPLDPATGVPRFRNGKPATPPGPDEQRPVPPNLDPDTLFLPQTPKERAAGIPPTPRKMTREEFSSYDPEPEITHPDHKTDDNWTNPAYRWWEWRLNTRPGADLLVNLTNAADSRASAEFGGEGTARIEKQRIARRAEIYQALNHNPPLPIPPFDPADPRYVCEPAEPRRRGKGKKNKDKP